MGVGNKKVFCNRARKFRLIVIDAWTSYIHLEFIRYRIDGLGMEEFLGCYKLTLHTSTIGLKPSIAGASAERENLTMCIEDEDVTSALHFSLQLSD